MIRLGSLLRRSIEYGFKVQLAGFGELEGAGEIGVAGGFEKDDVGAGGKSKSGRGVAVEFAVDIDFCGVGFGSDTELTEAVGRGI
jgi:hypothetical protein